MLEHSCYFNKRTWNLQHPCATWAAEERGYFPVRTNFQKNPRTLESVPFDGLQDVHKILVQLQ